MKASLTALDQFISDFNLRQPNGVISFTASIHFTTGEHTEIVGSEVQVITSDNVGAIYFFNIPGKVLPDMFSVRKNVFTYLDRECLKIESGEYTVTVFPDK